MSSALFCQKTVATHPDAARRAEEIEAVKSRSARLDRVQMQAVLMAYEHLLSPRLRSRNQRIEGALP